MGLYKRVMCGGWNFTCESPNMISPKVKQGRIKGEEGVERGSLSLSLTLNSSGPSLSLFRERT
jgi:hypothetical protein